MNKKKRGREQERVFQPDQLEMQLCWYFADLWATAVLLFVIVEDTVKEKENISRGKTAAGTQSEYPPDTARAGKLSLNDHLLA